MYRALLLLLLLLGLLATSSASPDPLPTVAPYHEDAESMPLTYETGLTDSTTPSTWTLSTSDMPTATDSGTTVGPLPHSGKSVQTLSSTGAGTGTGTETDSVSMTGDSTSSTSSSYSLVSTHTETRVTVPATGLTGTSSVEATGSATSASSNSGAGVLGPRAGRGSAIMVGASAVVWLAL